MKVPQCENCNKRLDLKICINYREKRLGDLLEELEIDHICLAFVDENIGVIGSFKGAGCEEFEPKENR